MAASAIAKGLTQLLSRNVGARITTSFKPSTSLTETINQPLKLRKFAEKQAEQLGPEDASKIIGEGEEGLPLLLYHRVFAGRKSPDPKPFQKFKGQLEKDSPAGYDFLSTGLSKKGMGYWTRQVGHPDEIGGSGERVLLGMGKVNKLFDHNNPDHVNDLFKKLRKDYIDKNLKFLTPDDKKAVMAHPDWKKNLRKKAAELKERKEDIKRGHYFEIEDYEIQKALKDLGYDSFTTIEHGKNVMLFNPNEQFVPLFDPLKKSAIGFSRGGGLSSLNEKV